MVILTIGLIAPVANGLGRGRGQHGVSAERADFRHGTVFAYQDFENDIAGAPGRSGLGRIMRLGAAEQQGIGFVGGDPDAWWTAEAAFDGEWQSATEIDQAQESAERLGNRGARFCGQNTAAA